MTLNKYICGVRVAIATPSIVQVFFFCVFFALNREMPPCWGNVSLLRCEAALLCNLHAFLDSTWGQAEMLALKVVLQSLSK